MQQVWLRIPEESDLRVHEYTLGKSLRIAFFVTLYFQREAVSGHTISNTVERNLAKMLLV